MALASVLAVGAVLAAALPARALVLSFNAGVRGISKANDVKARAAQSTYPRCDIEVVDSSDREDDAKAAADGAADAVEVTEPPSSSATAPANEKKAALAGHAPTSKRSKKNSPEKRALAKQLYEMEKARSRMSEAVESKEERSPPATAAEQPPRRSPRLLAKR